MLRVAAFLTLLLLGCGEDHMTGGDAGADARMDARSDGATDARRDSVDPVDDVEQPPPDRDAQPPRPDGDGAADDADADPIDATDDASDADPSDADPDGSTDADPDAPPAVCGDMTEGTCETGECLCCPTGGPTQACLCTRTCRSHSECTDPGKPRCNAPGASTGGGDGICTAVDFFCAWGTR